MKNFNKSTLAAAVGSATLALAMSAPVQAESSVNISGWINESMFYYDDGSNSDIAQVPDNGTTLGSRITFSGNTDLANTALNAGFEVILEPTGNDLTGTPSNNPLTAPNQASVSGSEPLMHSPNILGSSVNVGGPFGKVTLGLQSMPTDNIAVLADPSATLWPSISPVFRGNNFAIQGMSGAGTWGSFLRCQTTPGLGIGLDCNGIYRQGLRYDLPQFVDGLNIAVGMANDDIYDVAAKYNTEFAGRINTMLHVGYAENHAPGSTNTFGPLAYYGEAQNFQTQLGVMDSVTGLFGTLAYQHEDISDANPVNANAQDDSDAFWGKIGIKKKWTAVGDTSIAFQYGQYNDQYGDRDLTDSEVERIGVEVAQYFGSNLMLYGVWENLSLDTEGPASAQFDGADDLDTFTLGLTYFF